MEALYYPFLFSRKCLKHVFTFFLKSLYDHHTSSLIRAWIIAIAFTLEPRYEKTGFCICENKDADQLRGNREADQRLCFRYTDSIIPLLSKSEISSL